METICHNENSVMAYPEITPGATKWAWSDTKPPEETVLVTAHGLRRLLRLASDAFAFAMFALIEETNKPLPDDKKIENIYREQVAREKATSLLNESSSVFCEGHLVMSRLFVDKDGNALAHKDETVDQASIPPWEKTLPEKR